MSKPEYRRFIPREELQGFRSWNPGAFGGAGAGAATGVPPNAAAAGGTAAGAPAAAPVPPAEPTAAEWAARVQAARQTGYQDGYRDGLVALENFKASFASQATAQVGALLDAFDAQMHQLDASVAKAVAGAAVQLARQVLHAELAVRPELVARVAAEAVGSIMLSARQITVQVHPADLPLVSEGADEALKSRGARLVPNPAIERGGVLVASDVGTVDARLATRWAQAAANLGSDAPLHGVEEPDLPTAGSA
jgi:flagellar assembly protein FliH